MTPDQIKLVRRSFAAAEPIAETAAALFYTRLFETDPALKPLFAHTDIEAQGRKLMAALGFVVAHLDRPEELMPAAQELALRHVRYGVRPQHYDTVGEALFWTLERGLGEAFTPAIRDAWAQAYAALATIMIMTAYPMRGSEPRKAA
jgi:nitric oxide dioxygenase